MKEARPKQRARERARVVGVNTRKHVHKHSCALVRAAMDSVPKWAMERLFEISPERFRGLDTTDKHVSAQRKITSRQTARAALPNQATSARLLASAFGVDGGLLSALLLDLCRLGLRFARVFVAHFGQGGKLSSLAMVSREERHC